jgi:hypothetical protein
MKFSVILTLTAAALISSCGPDRNLLMDTKFDAGLRQKVMQLSADERTEMLDIIGQCCEAVDGSLRQQLLDAGAEVMTMTGEMFTARISSDDLFSLAALECVTQVQLAGQRNPLQH